MLYDTQQLREDTAHEMLKKVMEHILEMVQEKIYGFSYEREESNLISLLVIIGNRLKAKLIAQNLVEHVKSRSDCIKLFN